MRDDDAPDYASLIRYRRIRRFWHHHMLASTLIVLSACVMMVILVLWPLGVPPMYALRSSFDFVGTTPAPLPILLAALVALVAGVALHMWHQTKATVEMASRWSDGPLARVRKEVRDKIPIHPPLSAEKLMEKLNGDPDLRSDVVTLLNHLDMVAVGVEHGTFRMNPIRHLYLGIICHYYEEFLPLIYDFRRIDQERWNGDLKRKEDQVWFYFQIVARRWLDQELNEDLEKIEQERRLPTSNRAPNIQGKRNGGRVRKKNQAPNA